MNKKLLFLLCFILLNLTIYAQNRLSDEIVYKIKNEAFANSSVEELAQFLTDELGPRLAGSQLNARAEAMVAQKLTELGFSGSSIEFASEFSKGGWDNEQTYVAMTAPYYCSFSATPKAWSGSTNGAVKSECILVDIKSEEDFEKYRGKLEGKIVLLPSNENYEIDFEPLATRLTDEQLEEIAKDPRPSQRRRSSYNVDYRTVMAMQRKINQMIQHEKPLAIIGGGGSFNVPASRSVQYKSGDPEPLPEIILPIENHARMVRLLAKGVKVEMELDVKNSFSQIKQINNVVAEIPGSDPKLKSEVVLLGAHLDSWHGGTGAADNASGCAVMIEAMRIIKALGITPKRTIRIALWGGEEQGMYGSRGYATTKLFDSKAGKKLDGYDKFALYLNMDNGSGRFRGIYLEENDLAVPFMECWKKPFESLGFNTITLRRTGGTDHTTFSRLGLPAYQFIQDDLEYERTYHTNMDTYERLSFADLKVNAAIVAWLALNAAQDSDRIPVKPGFPENLNK